MSSSATQTSRFAVFRSSLGADKLLLRNASVQEALSAVFQIDLDLQSEDGSIDFNSVLGNPGCVELTAPSGKKRYFHGTVTRFVQLGGDGTYSNYQATLLPNFWLLTLSSHCRIYRDMTALDIVKRILGEQQVAFEDRVHGTYQKMEFCVQYRETDFNFCSRLLEQEGIYYFFTHEESKHTLVLVDSLQMHQPFPGYATIDFRPHDDDVFDGEFIREWSSQKSMRSNRYAHTDFDFKKPKNPLLKSQQTSRYPSNRTFEIYDYPGGYIDPTVGDNLAKVRMDEIATQYEFRNGEGDSRGIATGFRFQLGKREGSIFPRDEDYKEYLVVAAHHTMNLSAYKADSSGTGGAAPFMSTFTAMSQDKQFRPQRATPKPNVQGIQTAMVVGPQGNEIYTDEYGRIRVQFHWDRDGKNDETSSCWIRVAQTWAGKNWGAIMTPRIGQEVIVEFLEGDPDRPIVTGCVYNGNFKPPYPLPQKEAISGVKTNSTKGGQGYNEWSMDDTAGSEKIVLHGQRDMETKIEHDRTTTIVHNDTLTVTTGDQVTKIEAGKSVIEAMQSIELKVGENSIMIDQSGIAINGIMIRLN